MANHRLPKWVTNRMGNAAAIHRLKSMLRAKKLHTVCESAMCPNLGECFSRKTATFMILGDHCTRECTFCAVSHARPSYVDPEESQQIVEAVRELGLRHVVITSVTRDDLPDGGSGQFAEVVRLLRKEIPSASIEVLTPDFQGDREAIRSVVESGPDIYNHNIETVPRLYAEVRSASDYRRSLDLLFHVKWCSQDLLTKSGVILGLGEQEDEVVSVMRDLRDVGCDLITLGQYLRPRKKNFPVVEYISEERFEEYERIGYELGFQMVLSGPLVRSSFRADEAVSAVRAKAQAAITMNAQEK